MKATLQVHMGNAAFGERPATELARILRNIADDVDDHCLQYVGDAVFAIDINGNSVGKLEIIEDGRVPKMNGVENQASDQQLNVDPADKYQEMRNENWADSNISDPY